MLVEFYAFTSCRRGCLNLSSEKEAKLIGQKKGTDPIPHISTRATGDVVTNFGKKIHSFKWEGLLPRET